MTQPPQVYDYPFGPNSGQSVGPPGMGPPVVAVQQPGGDLLTRVLHPAVETVEELYRTLPEGSWFSPAIAPSNPIQFELGSFTVPKGQCYWMFDYQFTPYRFSGIDPNDIVPLEEGRLATCLGYDVTINGQRAARLKFQLDPVAVQTQRGSFQPSPRSGALAFDVSAANSFASTVGAGTSVLPVRIEHYGPNNGPWTIMAKEGQVVALSCYIIRRIPIPLGCIEGRHVGYLLHTSISEALLNRLRPR